MVESQARSKATRREKRVWRAGEGGAGGVGKSECDNLVEDDSGNESLSPWQAGAFGDRSRISWVMLL